MPEPQPAAGLGQHAGRAGLIHRRDQVGHAPAQHDGQIGDGELHTQQGRGLQDLPGRPGHEAHAVGDGRGQGAGRRIARQLDGARVGDGQAGAAGQRGHQLGEVERVARRAVGQPQQIRVRFAARQGRDQVHRGRVGERGQLEPVRVRYPPPQRQQVLAQGDRAHHPDQEQRHLPRRPGQPSPQGDADRVGPLQVVDDQDGRPGRALLGHQGQQLLGQGRRDVRAAVGRDLTAQHPHDRGPAGIRAGLTHPQAVQERHQRQGLTQFVTGAPEDLAAGVWRSRDHRPHQCGLTNARFALDQHRATAPHRQLFYQFGQKGDLAVAADEGTGRRHRRHGSNPTTRTFIEQVGLFRTLIRQLGPGVMPKTSALPVPSCGANCMNLAPHWPLTTFLARICDYFRSTENERGDADFGLKKVRIKDLLYRA